MSLNREIRQASEMPEEMPQLSPEQKGGSYRIVESQYIFKCPFLDAGVGCTLLQGRICLYVSDFLAQGSGIHSFGTFREKPCGRIQDFYRNKK